MLYSRPYDSPSILLINLSICQSVCLSVRLPTPPGGPEYSPGRAPGLPVLGRIDFSIPHGAAHAASPTQHLRTLGAGDAHPPGIEETAFGQIAHPVRISDGAPAQADEGGLSRLDGSCRRVGKELAEPGEPRADDRKSRSAFLDFSRQPQEPGDAGEGVFVGRRLTG